MSWSRIRMGYRVRGLDGDTWVWGPGGVTLLPGDPGSKVRMSSRSYRNYRGLRFPQGFLGPGSERGYSSQRSWRSHPRLWFDRVYRGRGPSRYILIYATDVYTWFRGPDRSGSSGTGGITWGRPPGVDVWVRHKVGSRSGCGDLGLRSG